jgi:MFS family permease
MASTALLILAGGVLLITLASVPSVKNRLRALLHGDPGNANAGGLYFGWYVVAACLFIAFATVGARNVVGIFVLPMSEQFGWDRWSISLAGGLGFLVNGLAQPFYGQWFDRQGTKVIISNLFVVALGTVLMSLTFHYLFLVFMFGIVISMAASGASLNNTSALLARWFRRKRATVIGLNSAGVSLGSLILVPFGIYMIQVTNWRFTWVALGLIVFLAIPLAMVFLHDSPLKRGLLPDGDTEPPDEPGQGAAPGRLTPPLDTGQWRESFHSAPIWQVSSSLFVCGATTFVLSFHFVAFAQEDRGISPNMAGAMFAIMGGLNAVGSIGAGALSDRFSRKNMLTLVYFLRGSAYMILLVPPLLNIPILSGDTGIWLFAVIAGISWIATNPLSVSLTADVYGLRALGTITGVSFVFHQVGAFCGVLLAGVLQSVTGSYTIPLLAVGALLFPAALSAFTIDERRYSVRYQVQPAAAPAGD